MPIGGLPIVTSRPTTSGSDTLDTTVASVGPYALNIRCRGAHCSTRYGGHASPPVTTHSRSVSASASTEPSAAGVTKAWVTCSSRSSAVSSAPP